VASLIVTLTNIECQKFDNLRHPTALLLIFTHKSYLFPIVNLQKIEELHRFLLTSNT